MAYSPQQTQYANLTRAIAAQYGINQNIAEVQIYTESRFNPQARSHAGALGIAQFMPDTGRAYGLNYPNDFLNPEKSLHAYARHMRDLLGMFGGSYELALAAYNAGPGNVRKYGNKVPPFAETQNYVKKILPFLGSASSSLPSVVPNLINDGGGLALQGGAGLLILGIGVVLLGFALRD